MQENQPNLNDFANQGLANQFNQGISQNTSGYLQQQPCPTCNTCPTCGRVKQVGYYPYWGYQPFYYLTQVTSNVQ